MLGIEERWDQIPAAGPVVVGLGLLATPAGGHGRSGLVALGAVPLVVAVAVGIDAGRFAGRPAGDVTDSPSADGWPVRRTLSPGSVVVDLWTCGRTGSRRR